MKILFITRKYPPKIGGMEKLSYALSQEFHKHTNVTLITWGRSQKLLPFFIIIALLKALYLIPTNKIDRIHLGDALLSPLGILLKAIFRKKTTVTACGLDITFKFPPYQYIIPKCLNKLDQVICISSATLNECLIRGISKEKCILIPCGIYPQDFQIKATRKDLESILNIDLSNKEILVTIGRLVERKGVYWFIKNVFPKLDKDVIYIIIGEGENKAKIYKLISSLNYQKRIFLLGKLPDTHLKIVLKTADLFIMPNIKVPGDMEGFGIAAIEASSAGLLVIASNLEGIKDAIIHNRNGILIPSQNASTYISTINKILKDSSHKLTLASRFSEFTNQHYSWNEIGKSYLKVIAA